MKKIIDFAKEVIKDHIEEEDTAIDMTCGRGNDTLFLAKYAKKVYTFDIQKEALEETKLLLKDYNNVEYIHDTHANIKNYINTQIGCAMYNLGYLPKGDHKITTNAEEVSISIDKLLPLLKKKGIVTICVYHGHEEGKKEKQALETKLESLNQKEYEVLKYQFVNQINNPPFLYIIQKL